MLEVEVATPMLSVVAVAAWVDDAVPSVHVRETVALPTGAAVAEFVTVTVAVHLTPLPVWVGPDGGGAETTKVGSGEGLQGKQQVREQARDRHKA